MGRYGIRSPARTDSSGLAHRSSVTCVITGIQKAMRFRAEGVAPAHSTVHHPRMNYRRAIALISLISCMVALYLALWKMGFMGKLSCGSTHGCEYVQGSRYGMFLGVDVALIGTVGYAALVAVALAGTSDALADVRWPTQVLRVLIYAAVLFTLRLKYAEFVILKSFCPWCAVSAVAITLNAVLVTLDWRRVRANGGASTPFLLSKTQ
jgi:uncharacterized membrane protein